MFASFVSPPTCREAFSMGDMHSIPTLLGITYGLDKALPNLFRHCLIPSMENTGHIGAKLKQEAERLGLKPAQVAEKFGVKPPSVYDWYEHGRIHKKHYPTLVELSGKPLQWWLDFPSEGTQTCNKHHSNYFEFHIVSLCKGSTKTFKLFLGNALHFNR